MRNLADLVKVSSIEKVTVNGTEYTAINLDISGTITTTATTCISTMPWHSGATEALPGHKDGCTFSLTAGKTPLRVAGVEVLDGSYTIGLQTKQEDLIILCISAATVRNCQDQSQRTMKIQALYIPVCRPDGTM